MKNGYDKELDFIGLENPKKYKVKNRNSNQEALISLKNMGPPNFLKKRFKISTIDKFKNVNGLFFGGSKKFN